MIVFSEHPHQKMLLLDAMIQHLGEINSWPSYILQHLFIDNPSPTRPKKLKRVMAFFFGNSVPLELAYEFYNACNGRHSRFVVEQSTEWYRDWRESRYKRHMYEYYSIIFKKVLYINGSLWNQHEPVLPEVTGLEFGIDHTTHPLMIARKLEAIKTMEV